MGAPATAPRRALARSAPTQPRRTTTRRQPARRSAQRRGVTPAAGLAIPAAAVGRTAVAVGDLADSGVVVRLTRSRLWIGLVGALLVGIVALNVATLSISASGSQAAQQAERLERESSTLRAELSSRLSNEKIGKTGAKLGLIAPEPGAIRYLETTEKDAKRAAKRLLGGELSAGALAEADVAEIPAATEPGVIAPPLAIDPAATAAPVAPAPAPTETEPAAPTPVP